MRPISCAIRTVLIVAILFGLLPVSGCALIDRWTGKPVSPPVAPNTTQNSALPLPETVYRPETGVQAEQSQRYADELSAEVIRLQTELEAKEQTIQNLDASFQRQAATIIPPNAPLPYNPVIKIEGVRILPRDGDTLRIAIDDAVLFSPSGVQLLPNADEVLGTVIKEIRVNYPNNTLGIEGHADPVLENPQNEMYTIDLTSRKANAVAMHLLDQRKVTSKQIKVTGHGTADPLPGGRAEKNNRIEIVVFP